MRIRRAEQGDAAAIARIYVESWQAAFADVIPRGYLAAMGPHSEEPGWRAMFADARWPTSGALIAELERAPVAFAGFGAATEDASMVAEVGTFYSLREVWGTGVGRRLMDDLLRTLGEAGYGQATLWVLEVNERARRFYEAAGWRADGATDKDVTGGVELTKLRYRRYL